MHVGTTVPRDYFVALFSPSKSVAEHRKTRKSELLDRNILWIERGRRRTHGGSCSPMSRRFASLSPRDAWLTALTRAPRELQSNYGDPWTLVDSVEISAFSSQRRQVCPAEDFSARTDSERQLLRADYNTR